MIENNIVETRKVAISKNSKEAPKEDVKVEIAISAKRIFAGVIDFTVIMMVLNGIHPVFIEERWDVIPYEESAQSLIPLYIFGIVLVLCKDLFGGRSVGKRFLNMSVRMVDKERSLPSLKALILRNAWLAALPVEIFFLLTDRYCRRMGDKFSGTFVLETKHPPQIRRLSVKVVGGMLAVASLWMISTLSYPLGVQKSQAYRDARNAIYRDEEVIRTLGRVADLGYWPEMENLEGAVRFVIQVRGAIKESPVQVMVPRDDSNEVQVTVLEEKDVSKE